MTNLLNAEPKIRIYPEKLIEFFDRRQEDNGYGTHTSAINAWIGEDLVLGLYIDHLSRSGVKDLALISYKCTTGKRKRPHLDAWIACDGNVLRQVEVKNWAANAIGGEQVDPEPDEKDLVGSAKRIFVRYFNHPKVKDKVLKVLEPDMFAPEGCETLDKVPTLAVWSVIAQKRHLAPCFSVKNTFRPESPFKLLDLFSASLCLREQIKRKRRHIAIYMPRFRRRMQLLKTLTDLSWLE